jgi:hypothetical protein
MVLYTQNLEYYIFIIYNQSHYYNQSIDYSLF